MKNPFKKEDLSYSDLALNEVDQVQDHQHQWETYAKTYGSPRRNIEEQLKDSPAVIEKALFGVTTLILKCIVCHALLKEEMLGSDEQQLHMLVDKVNTYGPQYFQDNNITYVIQRYVPTPKSVMDLPMRPA